MENEIIRLNQHENKFAGKLRNQTPLKKGKYENLHIFPWSVQSKYDSIVPFRDSSQSTSLVSLLGHDKWIKYHHSKQFCSQPLIKL